MRTRVSRVIALIMALTLVFAMCSAPSYASTNRSMGAWILSALTALNITWNSTIAPAYQAVDYFVDPFQISNTGAWEKVPYTWDNVDDILDKSTLSFNGNKVIIDGKEYQDIWLSHDAADKFRTNAFDIKSAFNISSNSNGRYVSGAGYVLGLPVFRSSDGYASSQVFNTSGVGRYAMGNKLLVEVTSVQYGRAYAKYYLTNGTESTVFSYNEAQEGNYLRSGKNNNTFQAGTGNISSGTFYQHLSIPDVYVDMTPFDFDWVSGEIPAESMSEDDGLHIYVPTNPSQWRDSPATQQVINNYNNFLTNNPEFSPGVDIELDKDSGVLSKISNLLEILKPIIDLLKPEFGPKADDIEPGPDEPFPDPVKPDYPDPDPEPGTTLPDIDWKDLFQTIKNIWHEIVNGNYDRQVIGNLLSQLRYDFKQILNQIQNDIQSIKNSLDNLIDNLLHHDADWFRDVVDAIKRPFLRWLDIFKQGVSIWHYVVEWLQNISEPFQFFLSALNNTNPIFMSPFYAVAAAAIVIAIYRRFGR